MRQPAAEERAHLVGLAPHLQRLDVVAHAASGVVRRVDRLSAFQLGCQGAMSGAVDEVRRARW